MVHHTKVRCGMVTEKKKQSLWGLIIIAAILSGLSYWTYTEIAKDYATVEHSNRMMQALLENQTQFVRKYAAQIIDFKKDLAQNQEQIQKLQSENTQLKSKLSTLDNVAALEEKIAQLELANAQMQQDMDLAASAYQSRESELQAKLQKLIDEQDFKSVDEGRAILAKYKKKIHQIKLRIRDFRMQDRVEENQARLSLGNNGYLMRNGQQSFANVAWPPSAVNKDVKIDVNFVK
jgi:predicted RNase H-like nuclease (RuvC/YqgF family)